MKKKLLATAIVIAGALVLPTMAAQDTSGMRYTSASEGFYASLRVQFNSGGENTDSAGNVTDNGAGIENSTSRFGVRGTNDLGDGWQGFYQYEAGVDIDDGGSLSTRLAHVGVRGGFGQLQVGTFWPASYSWVHGSTDVANWASGSFIHATLLPGRQSRALEYTTPDINGFQAAVFIEMDPNRDGEGALSPAVSTPDVYGPATFDQAAHDEIALVVLTLTRTTTLTDDERERLLSRLVVVTATLVDRTGQPQRLAPTSSSMTVTLDAAGNGPFGITRDTPITLFGVGATAITVSFPSVPTDLDNPLYFFDTAGGAGAGLFNQRDEPVIVGVRTFTPGTAGGNPKDDNDIDLWSLSSKYSFQGFDAGVSYTVAPDGIEKSSGSRKDLSLYALRFGYAQDNWYVTSWYAEDNAGDDANRNHDTETFSIAAGVAVGKVNLYAVYEQQESDNYEPETATAAAVPSTGTHEDEIATVGMQYNLGSRSRVWVEYAGQDLDTDKAAEDYINIGLRHDL